MVETKDINVVVETEEVVVPIEAIGVQGPKGDKGDTALSVEVGTTTTGEAGTNASVTNSGTATDLILNFTIPKGDKGDKGEKGSQGETGPKGEQGNQGNQGPKGDDGVGVPAGGTEGQVLMKKSNTDYDTEWKDASSGDEKTSNKVTSLSSSSTDTQYPSAKCVYDLIGNIETILTTLTTGNGV